MKSSLALVALAAGISHVTATGFHDAPSYSCPDNSDNQCTSDMTKGFDWSDLNFGSFGSYKGFTYSGYTCSQKFGKRDEITGRSFQSKCITGQATGSTDNSPKISCDKSQGVDKTSISEFQVTPEFDCDLEFHYTMPDGSTCKHRTSCKSSGTTVKNTQCGGATDVTVVYPSQPDKPKDTCDYGIHSIGFDCSGPKPTKSHSYPVSTPTYPVNTPTYPASSSTAPASSPSSYPVGSPSSYPVGSPSSPASTPASTPAESTPVESTYPAESSTIASSSTAAVSTPSVTPPTSSVPGSYPVYTPSTSSVPVESTSAETTPAETTPAETTPAESTPAESTPAGSTSAVSTPVESTPAESTPVSTPVESTPAQSTPAESTTVGSSSTAAVSTPAESTVYSVTSYITTSTVFSTSIHTITSCAPDVPNCPAGSTAVTTVIVPISTTVCPVTETVSQPAGTPTSTPIETGSSPASSPVSSPVGSSATSAIAQTSTTPAGPVETLPCPGVVPSCLNTWMFSVGCKDNTESSCYCPDNAFVNNIFACLYAHGESDEVISEAVSYFQGICAPFVPSNPGIATGAETITTVLTVTPTSIASYTTISVIATTVVPCTDSVGEVIPSSSSTVVISTAMTVPQVIFTTYPASGAASSSVAVIPGTYPVATPTATSAAVSVPYPTGSAVTTFTTSPSAGGYPVSTPATTSPIATAGASRMGAGLGFLGIVVMAVAAL
ncbi:hypothetical protein F5Y09DRAFT_171359 [Xylaria sp. FL1042]|nr:hypothetical protein F5Y09DRAFT_171359 [Xylaria sp. FL1042]